MSGLAQELAKIVVEKRAEMLRNVTEDRKRLAIELAERWVPLRKIVFEQAEKGIAIVEGNPKMSEYEHLDPVELEVIGAAPEELKQMHKDGCLRVFCVDRSWKNLTMSFDVTKLVVDTRVITYSWKLAKSEVSKDKNACTFEYR